MNDKPDIGQKVKYVDPHDRGGGKKNGKIHGIRTYTEDRTGKVIKTTYIVDTGGKHPVLIGQPELVEVEQDDVDEN